MGSSSGGQSGAAPPAPPGNTLMGTLHKKPLTQGTLMSTPARIISTLARIISTLARIVSTQAHSCPAPHHRHPASSSYTRHDKACMAYTPHHEQYKAGEHDEGDAHSMHPAVTTPHLEQYEAGEHDEGDDEKDDDDRVPEHGTTTWGETGQGSGFRVIPPGGKTGQGWGFRVGLWGVYIHMYREIKHGQSVY